MSLNPFRVPPKPAQITLDSLPELFAHHRARFGGWTMTQTPPEQDPPGPGQPGSPAAGGGGDTPPERPADIAEDEWAALADPGKRAIVRERARADAAERALAASRARPGPAKKEPAATPPAASTPPAAAEAGQMPDIAAIVKQAVEAAVKPFAERDEQREAVRAAEKVQADVIEAAKPLLHDATDALAGIDLTTVVDEHGKADPAKVKAALDDLVTRKPHLAKAGERKAPPGIGGGGPVGVPEAEKVKAVLADMQRATGVRIPPASTNS